MFTPIPMRQVNVFVDAIDVESATITLARTEAFHLDPAASGGNGDEEKSGWNKLADRYTSQKQRLDAVLDALDVQRVSMPPPQRLSPEQDAGGADDILKEAEAAVDDWQNRKKENDAEIKHLEYLAEEMTLFEPLQIPVEQIRNPAYLHWIVGTMPRENLDSLRLALFESTGKEKRSPGTRRINIFVPAAEVEEATLALLKTGNFVPEKATAEQWAEKSSHWQKIAESSKKQVERIETHLKGLDLEIPDLPLSETTFAGKDEGEYGKKLDALEKEIQDWQDRKAGKEDELGELQERIENFRQIESADVPVEAIRTGHFLHWVFGTISNSYLKEAKIVASGMPAVVVPIDTSGDRAVVAGATLRTHAGMLDTLLDSTNFEPIDLPEEEGGTPSDLIAALNRRIESCRTRLAEIENERKRASGKWRQQLTILLRRARTDARVAGAISEFACKNEVFLVSGRAPDKEMETLIITVENATGGRAEVEILESARQRELPVEVMLFRIPFVVLPTAVTDHGDRILVVAATARDYADTLEGAVRGVFLEPITLPEDVTGTPSDILSNLDRRLADARKRREELEAEQRQLARRWGRRLLTFRQILSADLEVARAITRFTRRKDVFLVSGWVPESGVDKLITLMETTTEGRTDIEIVEPKPGGRRRPPTLMRNPRFLRPFEAITGTFGTPGYHEIDPTPLAALTYTLMYGVMFGDIGHGLILVLFGMFLYSRTRGDIARSLGAILAGSGVCAMCFGVLYGSVFGREDIFHGLLLTPMSDVMALMTYSIAGGIVLLNIGFFAAMANAIRTKNRGALLFGHSGLAGLWFYWATLGGGYALIQGWISIWIELALLAVPIVLLLFQDPLGQWANREPRKGPVFHVESAFELFDAVIRNFTNTLSFVRLGAFAVAHAGLMHIVFMLAENSGYVSGWLIIIFGTLLVVAFEGLVVAIQALRLEYYEFFSKFFDGRGKAFAPFKLIKTG